MNHPYQIKPLSTLGRWIVASFVVFPMTVIIIGLISVPLFMLVSIVHEVFGYDNNFVNGLGSLAVFPFIGMILGATMAFLQRNILRNHLYWVADHWYRWTIIGGAVGAIITGTLAGFFQYPMLKYFGDVVFLMPVFLTIMSAFQLIALRQAVKQAWMWIVGNLVGGIVFAGILTSNQPSYYNPNSEILFMLYALFSVLALGAITGMVILFLFENKLLPMQSEDKIGTSEDKKPSVWDQAI